jgi:uncharacterized protein
MDVAIHPARPEDLPQMTQLLHTCALQDTGLVAYLRTALIARDVSDVVGCVAIEVHSGAALLRSLAVAPARRGQGLGIALTEQALSLAWREGAAHVYLLTQTAAGFFARFGFRATARTDAPQAIQMSTQFLSETCQSAVCMSLALDEIGGQAGGAEGRAISIQDARRLYSGAESAHDFDHVQRVLALAERIARAEGADLAIVRAAALLHDIARNDESLTGVDHALAAAQRAHGMLLERGATPAFVGAVCVAIRDHRFRTGGPPQTLEARILYDADKLDAIGAIGVARAYAVAGRTGQRLWSAVDSAERLDPADPTALPAEHTPVREFVVKLARLKQTLHTVEARRIARGRHRFMVAFFRRLTREVSGEE